VHRGHFQVPCGMAVRGGRRQSICHPALHMSQRSMWCLSNGGIFDNGYRPMGGKLRQWRGGRERERQRVG